MDCFEPSAGFATGTDGMAAPLQHTRVIDNPQKLRVCSSDNLHEAQRRTTRGLARQQRQPSHQKPGVCTSVDSREKGSSEPGSLESCCTGTVDSLTRPPSKPAGKASATESKDRNEGPLHDGSLAALCNRRAESALVGKSHDKVMPQVEPSGGLAHVASDLDPLAEFAESSMTPEPSPQGGF